MNFQNDPLNWDDDEQLDQSVEFVQKVYIPIEEEEKPQIMELEGTYNQSIQFDNRRQLPFDPFDLKGALINFNMNFMEEDCLKNIDNTNSVINNLNNGNSSIHNGTNNTNNKPQMVLKCINLNQNKQMKYTIDQKGARIGKFKDYEIQFTKESSISRDHCHITFKNYSNNFYIQDKGSKSGTFIRVKDRSELLKENRIFEIGYNEIQITSITYKDNDRMATVMLKIIEGNCQLQGEEKKIQLFINKPFIMGQSEDANMQITGDNDLDSKHVQIQLHPSRQISIQDMNSKKGTWMRLSPSKQVSEPYMITDKCEIKLYPYVFRVDLQNTSIQSKLSNSTACIRCLSQQNIYQLYPCLHKILCKECEKLYKLSCPLKSCQFSMITNKVPI